MFHPRPLSLLSSAERHLLRQQWRQSGQCYRCFHASRSRMADEGKPAAAEGANDTGTPYNKPARGPTRQQRAAQISSEVSALAADLPNSNLHSGRNAEVDGSQNQDAESRSPGLDPRSEGHDLRPGRMGENNNPTREGPFAQGVGRLRRDENEVPNEASQVRITRNPAQGMEEPGAGGASVMEGTGMPQEIADSSQPTSGTVEDIPTKAPAVATSAPTSSVEPVKRTPQKPETYLELGLGHSTPASCNYTGLLADRAGLLASPGVHQPTARETRRRIRSSGNKLTAFHSPEQKAATMRERTELEARLADLRKERKSLLDKGTSEAELPKSLQDSLSAVRAQISVYPSFVPLQQRERTKMIDRLVLGKYDPQGLLSGKQPHKQAVLNEVARQTLRNGTYLNRDGERFLAKVRSLMPAATPAARPAAAGAGKGKQGQQAAPAAAGKKAAKK